MNPDGKVGVAPGTTTLVIGRGGSVSLVGTQDPGVKIRSASGELVGAELGYFDARPTDMELSKIYGYTPVHRGWISGRLSDAQLGDGEWRTAFKVAGALLGGAIGAYFAGARGRGWGAVGGGAGAAAGAFIFRIIENQAFPIVPMPIISDRALPFSPPPADL